MSVCLFATACRFFFRSTVVVAVVVLDKDLLAIAKTLVDSCTDTITSASSCLGLTGILFESFQKEKRDKLDRVPFTVLVFPVLSIPSQCRRLNENTDRRQIVI